MNVLLARFSFGPSASFGHLAIGFLLAFVTVGQATVTGSCQEGSKVATSRYDTSIDQLEVSIDGKWTTPKQLAADHRTNPVLQEYVSLRNQTPDTFDGQTGLARWCGNHSLTQQREAHLKRALGHDPGNRQVHRQLGHVMANGVWLTREQVQADQSRLAAAERRFEDWKKPVSEIANLLGSRSESRQQAGLRQLDGIDDPRSITALENILIPVNEQVAEKTLDVIDRFSQREATESVLRIAAFSPWPTIQQRALDSLGERNWYDFVPLLMEQMVTPFSTQYAATPDARGNVLYQYVLFQQDMNRDAVLQFETLLLQNPRSDFLMRPNLTRDALRRSNRAEQMVNAVNETIAARNDAILNILRSSTGASPGDTPADWWQWWYEQNDVTMYERPVSFTLVQASEMTTERSAGAVGECLVAGTPVWTERGPLPVESVMIGDRVLCLNFETRELEYCNVLQPTRRPPTPTFRISLQDREVIQASGGHLFWALKHGWMKVRDLKPEMQLAAVGSVPATIRQIEPSETVPLHNLIVDRHANYFVGNCRILSHDSTIRDQGEVSVEHSAPNQELAQD